MENVHDYKNCAILYVDDEEMSLKFFHRAFGKKFRVLTAASAVEGYRLLEQHRNEIGLLMTDQRMPGEKGVQFLERARQLHPRAIRILTTAYSELDVAIEAVNSGAIYKYVTKPWDIPQLEVTLRRVLETCGESGSNFIDSRFSQKSDKGGNKLTMKCQRGCGRKEATYRVRSDVIDMKVCAACADEARRLGIAVEVLGGEERKGKGEKSE
jgi:DNA-binding NtrC family response regulator